eukprot:TRINITY_DN9437_c0_g1_i3.p1 TRINITY_DN9437_c0_g1~~TRINITY_DN9437_c0_g1_i3.p1  ORF type:complete len:325 (+),score=84.12 TRINITY_DN9437_c0_g1_i3:36-1010(+)
MSSKSPARQAQSSPSFRDSPGVPPEDDFFKFHTDESDEIGSGEDTDEASESETYQPREYTEIKEQMYQDKLAHLKKQLYQLEEGTHPEYMRRLKKVEQSYRERMRINQVVRELELEMAEQDYVNEKRAAVREFDEKKVYLREQLIAELEEKQKLIEQERSSMELTGDSLELKPINTRKLRRRGNEPNDSRSYPGEKRRKQAQATLTYLLDDNDISEDLKIINKTLKDTKPPGSPAHSAATSTASPSITREARVESGKLFYEKRWYRRGQTVFVDQMKEGTFEAVISAVGTEAIWIRRQDDTTSKQKICISHLIKGKVVLKRRAT